VKIEDSASADRERDQTGFVEVRLLYRAVYRAVKDQDAVFAYCESRADHIAGAYDWRELRFFHN
jgi:hypothetical protein